MRTEKEIMDKLHMLDTLMLNLEDYNDDYAFKMAWVERLSMLWVLGMKRK